MAEPRIVVTIEPDGVRADQYVCAVSVDGVERERATWHSIDKLVNRLSVLVYREIPRELR